MGNSAKNYTNNEGILCGYLSKTWQHIHQSAYFFADFSMAATLSEYIMKEPSTRGNFGNYGKSQEPLSRFRR